MIYCKCQSPTFGGLNIESMAILIALFTADGIKLSNTGHPVSRHGFVFT